MEWLFLSSTALATVVHDCEQGVGMQGAGHISAFKVSVAEQFIWATYAFFAALTGNITSQTRMTKAGGWGPILVSEPAGHVTAGQTEGRHGPHLWFPAHQVCPQGRTQNIEYINYCYYVDSYYTVAVIGASG